MKKPPPHWPQISSAVFYNEPIAAIDWLCKAFGFEVVIKVIEEGKLMHSELRLGEGIVMVADAMKGMTGAKAVSRRSPMSIGGGNTQSLMAYVDDVDALVAQARAAGAKVLEEPRDTDYGPEYWTDRGAELEDLEGHHWWFSQRLRNPPAT